MKTPYVSELEPNQLVQGVFLVQHKEIRQKKTGEPYLSLRDQEHEHLGLGIFIAQTLLERTGAEVTFVNGLDGALEGAAVTIIWPRSALAL